MENSSIKFLGYLVSTASVVLLGIVSWKSADSDTVLMVCLIGGMATSVVGMALRWLSYQLDKKPSVASADLTKGNAGRSEAV